MLQNGQRVDEIGFGNLKLIQNADEFCYGVDAVLLSHFASSYEVKGKILDIGCGTGVIPLILSHKTEAESIYGLEVQLKSWETAVRNVELAGLRSRVTMVKGNVKDREVLDDMIIDTGRFDMVTMNPPYVGKSTGLEAKNRAKAVARQEIEATLEDFIKGASYVLKDRGHLCLVHRPSRITDIITFCRKYKLEPKDIKLVSPYAGKPPNLMLLHCVKGGGSELRFLPGEYVRNLDGSYSKFIDEVYERI